MGRHLAAIGASFLAFVLVTTLGMDAIVRAVTEDTVEIQDGAGNVADSVLLGDAVTFFVQDSDLATTGTGVGTWTAIETAAPAGTWWSFATGAPDPAAFALSAGAGYDSAEPANTPLSTGAPWTVRVDGIDVLVANISASTGSVTLLTDVEPGSTVEIRFDFDVLDIYSSSDLRVRASSTSDPEGEWVSLTEVVSETDLTGSPTSGLFVGGVGLSPDSRAASPVDGLVFAQHGETFTVTYYDAAGSPIASHSAGVDVSVPEPIPSAGPMALAGLGIALALLVAWRWRAESTAGPRQAH